jgi:hypothetical protein
MKTFNQSRTAVNSPIKRSEISENSEALPTYSEIRSWTYYRALKWCTGDDGRLRRDRLKRVAVARNYDAKWVQHNAGQYFVDVWEGVALWHKAQKAKRKRDETLT